jgi:hypothetical protein
MREYLNDAIQRSLTDHLLEKIKVIEKDCFKVDLKEIDEKINVYFYDGNHSLIGMEWAKEYPNFKK